MLREPFFIVITIAVLVVLGILLFGIGSFAKGGDFNRRNANRIMRWRIYAQAFAVVIIVAFAWGRSKGWI